MGGRVVAREVAIGTAVGKVKRFWMVGERDDSVQLTDYYLALPIRLHIRHRGLLLAPPPLVPHCFARLCGCKRETPPLRGAAAIARPVPSGLAKQGTLWPTAYFQFREVLEGCFNVRRNFDSGQLEHIDRCADVLVVTLCGVENCLDAR